MATSGSSSSDKGISSTYQDTVPKPDTTKKPIPDSNFVVNYNR
jgi:hypothetical protein